MRCPTCERSAYRGYLPSRGFDEAGSRRYNGLAPCPDCGGSTWINSCEGLAPESEASRAYRCYLLDERGMVFLAETVDADSDDEAVCQSFGRLSATLRASAVEVWEGRRRVELRPRAESTAYALPMISKRDHAEAYW